MNKNYYVLKDKTTGKLYDLMSFAYHFTDLDYMNIWTIAKVDSRLIILDNSHNYDFVNEERFDLIQLSVGYN